MLTTATDTSLELSLLHAVLNQVDYGLAVVATDTRMVLFANAPAVAALQADSPLKTGLTLQTASCAPARPVMPST
jgi:hypothetical protein